MAALLALMLASAATAQSARPAAYPSDFVSNYLRNCIARSQAQGLEVAESRQLCDCTLKQFQQQYSFNEFKQLTASARTNPQAQANLTKVGEACFEAVLFQEN
ncbi:MAG: hypothetical protein HC890_18105 [Chloroflexaceae bacterium]|nr:hypothetical protein [Chloroflexaceae bacterium]